MSNCIACTSKDEQIQHLKDMSQELDDRVTRLSNGIEYLLREDTSSICFILAPLTEGDCIGTDCGSVDCHTKLFNELVKGGNYNGQRAYP